MRQVDRRFAGRAQHLLDGLEQSFERFGQLLDAVETDDRQRALHLVQVGTAELDLGEVAGAGRHTGRILVERLIGAFERQVNFALDPGQRAHIEFGRSVHMIRRQCP